MMKFSGCPSWSKWPMARPIIWFMCHMEAPTPAAMRTPSPVLLGLP